MVQPPGTLYEDQRWNEDERLNLQRKGSWMWVWCAPISELTELWDQLRAGIEVKINGIAVLSMKPVVRIHRRHSPDQLDSKISVDEGVSRVPSS